MDDTLIVCELKCVADLWNHRQGGLGRPLFRLDQVSQVRAVDVFHDQVIDAVRDSEVVDGHHVRVVQLRQRSRFSLESFRKTRLGGRVRDDDLERHQAIEPDLVCFVHCSHAAMADQVQDFKLGKPRGEFFWFRCFKLRQRLIRGGCGFAIR